MVRGIGVPRRAPKGDVMSSSPAPKLLTLGDLFDLVRRRPILSVASAAGVMVLVLAFLAQTTPLYEAHASLGIDRGSSPVEWQVDPDTGKIEFGLLNTQKDLLLSQSVLGAATRTAPFDDDSAYRKADDRVAKLSHRIKVETSRDTWVIAVSLADEDAARAEAQLKAVLDAFIASQDERDIGRSRGALRFLSDQVIEAKRRLDDSRAAEARLRRESGIISTDPDHNFLAEEISSLSARRADLHAQMDGNQALMEQLADAGKRSEGDPRIEALLRIEPIRTNPVVIEQQRNLFALLNQRAQLGQKYLAKHPRMVEIESQVENQRALLTQAVMMASEGIAADHRKLELQEKDVSDTIATKEKELASYRENLASLQALESQTATRNALYDRLLTRQGEEEVSSHFSAKQVAVVDPPHARPKPVNISTLKFLAIALLAGGAVGVAVPLLFEGLDTRVRGALAAQVLTRLPLLGKAPRVARLVPLGKAGDPERPHALAEAYRNLRAAIRLSRRAEAGCQCLLVTSSRPYEGKSTVATRLALSLASAGAKVLLVDADMRKPTLATQLGETCERGLSAALEGEKGVRVLPTAYANLDFLGVGQRPRNPGDLLHSEQLRELVFAWRQAYDYVIFDTPPLGPVADAMVLGEVVDGLILVVRDHFTTKANIRAALARLAPLSHKVLGVVLNGERNAEASYGYYAHSARVAAVDPKGVTA
jgi:capsular exopolysaccharide synthesis family protein